jgi:hypothetical protein
MENCRSSAHIGMLVRPPRLRSYACQTTVPRETVPLPTERQCGQGHICQGIII